MVNNVDSQSGIEVILAKDIGCNVITIHNDGFKNKKPNIFNENIIPEKIRRAMSTGWDSTDILGRDIRIIELHDVIVGEQGLVLDSNFRVIKETITQHSAVEIEGFIKKAKSLTDIEYIQGKFLNLRKRGEQNYGHWLIECLPKISFLTYLDEDFGVLVPDVSSQMNLVIDTSLRLSGASSDLMIMKMGKNDIKRFQTLVIIDGLTNHGTYMAPQAVQFNNRLRDSVQGAGLQKVQLLRDSPHRRISNVDHLTSVLKDFGFTAITPGKLNFDEQISALKDADSVIGVMGAEMTNIVYANEGAKILNIAPASMPDTFFHFISVHKTHLYNEFRCETESQDQNRNSSMHVDIDNICEIVRNLSF
ncbi:MULTISPECIES: glycosyltransferase family 61 protein [unclassified Leclercia]|uniref:glycosyltransferase family 61 protein n=1 Tax=unclassified Leclercia TaxID=2627398 RepID=UPI0025B8B051|nr:MULTISPECIES: glycosyltransferase family 61 protein [unclassified Leclercia]